MKAMKKPGNKYTSYVVGLYNYLFETRWYADERLEYTQQNDRRKILHATHENPPVTYTNFRTDLFKYLKSLYPLPKIKKKSLKSWINSTKMPMIHMFIK